MSDFVPRWKGDSPTSKRFRLIQKRGRKKVEIASYDTWQACVRHGDRLAAKGELGLTIFTDDSGVKQMTSETEFDEANQRGSFVLTDD